MSWGGGATHPGKQILVEPLHRGMARVCMCVRTRMHVCTCEYVPGGQNRNWQTAHDSQQFLFQGNKGVLGRNSEQTEARWSTSLHTSVPLVRPEWWPHVQHSRKGAAGR